MAKTCKLCKTEKPADGFYARGGLVCIECTKARVRANRAANAEYYRMADAAKPRKRGKTERAVQNARSRKYYYANKDKNSARLKLNRALARGLVQKPSCCSRCNKPAARLEGHHPDYAKPLDVIWLCDPCHSAEHRKIDTTGFVPRKNKWGKRAAQPPREAQADG
jgi:hypothetical protein